MRGGVLCASHGLAMRHRYVVYRTDIKVSLAHSGAAIDAQHLELETGWPVVVGGRCKNHFPVAQHGCAMGTLTQADDGTGIEVATDQRREAGMYVRIFLRIGKMGAEYRE